MDYLELLKKYMKHVGNCEGTYFLGYSVSQAKEFTQEEIDELRRIETEVDQ